MLSLVDYESSDEEGANISHSPSRQVRHITMEWQGPTARISGSLLNHQLERRERNR